MQKIKKISIYDLNPRYFKDSNDDGIGDLKGLISKFDYFKYLGVDAIILQGIFSSPSKQIQNNYIKVASDIGTIEDIKNIIEKGKEKNIKIFIEMNIGSIPSNHVWFTESETEAFKTKNNFIKFQKDNKFENNENEEIQYSEKAEGYYACDTRTREIPLDWKTDKVLDGFISVAKFWNDLGINGFVFTNFEKLNPPLSDEDTTIMGIGTLRELRKLYTSIKEINDKIIIIGKSSIIELFNVNNYTKGTTKVFDYFQSLKFSLMGTNNKYGLNSIAKFSTKKLVARMQLFNYDNSHIVSFGSEKIGRFISRWGDDNQYHVESSKAFAMALMLTPASNTIYLGDELGARNIGLTHLDDFQDEDLEYRKLQMKELKLSEKKFMDAQVMQNPINARSLMMWNRSKNGGFSKNEKTITPVSSHYLYDNVEVQFTDKESVLIFYRNLHKLIHKSAFAEILKNGVWKISTMDAMFGIIKMKSTYDNHKLVIYINLTDGEKKIITMPKTGKVIMSTYTEEYKTLPKKLRAYEGIIVIDDANAEDGIKGEEKNMKKIKHIHPDLSQSNNNDNNEEEKLSHKEKVQKRNEEKAVIEARLEEAKKQFSIMREEVNTSHHTSLKEEDIAATTQLDVDNAEDLEEFIKKSE